jgi:membrane protein, antimicrobial resistance system
MSQSEDFPLPPPPPFPVQEEPAGPEMSTPETLSSIFFEPGRVFEALRTRPRFLVAGLIILLAVLSFTTLFYQRVGYENFVRSAVEASPRTANMTPEQKEQAITMQSGPFFKGLSYFSPLIGISLFFAIGGALYMLGVMMMGKSLSYKRALAVWVYSAFPPTLITMLLNILLLFLKSPDDYDQVQALRQGLARANLGFLVDSTAHPMMATALGTLDLLSFYGLFLAALGLRKVARLSSGAAWTIVLVLWLIGVILRVAISGFIGAM